MEILYEFAQSRKAITLLLNTKYTNYIEHLLKLYLIPDSNSHKHWIKEIINYYKDIPKLKYNHKYPSEKFIYYNIFGFMEDTYYGNIYSYVDDICYEYDLDSSDIYFNEDDFLEKVQECTKYISVELSKKGRLNYMSTYNIIESIFNSTTIRTII